jgi:hypothetical protein
VDRALDAGQRAADHRALLRPLRPLVSARADYPTFLRALVNECRGTLEAMRAIRKAIPGAKLVQTEDLGKTFSTQPLRYQAAHENERRWLSLDLLCGRVTPKHPCTTSCSAPASAGARWRRSKAARRRRTCSASTIISPASASSTTGCTSIPDHEVGGNGRDTYVDAEAVRVKRLRGRYRLRPAAARGVGALRHPDRDHRSASRLPPRRAIALVRGSLEHRQQLRAKAWTCARSPSGRCSAMSTGASC